MSDDVGTESVPLIRGVTRYYGAGPQPAADSYSSAELAGWLLAGAEGLKTEHAAVVFLIGHRTWLDRREWRESCVTLVDSPGGKRVGFVEWSAWRAALDAHTVYAAASDAEREGMPRGLEASPTAASAAAFAVWLTLDPLGLRAFDLVNTRAAAAGLAVLCGQDPAHVLGPPPEGGAFPWFPGALT